MKCIRCGLDSKHKDRPNRRCPGCRQPFAFEPQQGDKLTDAAFLQAIEAVSSRGQVRWGVEHLYYEVARRLRKKARPYTVAAAVFGVIGVAVLLGKSYLLATALIAIAAVGAFVAWLRRRPGVVQLKLSVFNRMWAKWQAVHQQPKGLIVRVQTRGSPAPPRVVEPDIADYSFDRAVICDRARTADLLLANNFHFENNCAVLSADGYPEGQFETIRAMLKRNPRLRVFALHDATPAGCRMARELAADSAWFAGQAKVTDVGLRPRQAGAFPGLFLSAGAALAAGLGVTGAEARWLSDYSLELAVIRPEQVLKRLYAAMHRTEETDFDYESFSYEASDAESDSDGFG